MTPNDILDFWFKEIEPKNHWVKDLEFDQEIKRRFLEIYESAVQGELWVWRDTAQGRLAEIIVLDQFPRNMFRDTPRAFEADPLALVLTQEAIRQDAGKELAENEKGFLYMPLMHSESKIVHEYAEKVYRDEKLGSLDYELKHKAIVDRFGRYPHRNKILGRVSTEEEIEFLKGPNSSF